MNSQIIGILEKHNVKPTAMRMLVLEQLLLKGQHLSLSELEDILYPADRITIYRTLQTFVKSGIAHAVDAATNGTVYGLCPAECDDHRHVDDHPHFVCENCKRITCSDDFSYVLKQKSDSTGYIVHKVEMTIRGLCPDCAKK